MDRSPLPRVLRLALAAGIAVTPVAGCGAARHPGTPGGTNSPSASAPSSSVPSASAPAASVPAASPSSAPVAAAPTVTSTGAVGAIPDGYPSDAQAYAQATIAAWVAGQTSRLAQLTTADVAATFANISGHPDPHWQVASADGAAGSSYLTFRNADGDELRLRVVNQYLGQPHAVAEAIFNRNG